MKGNGPQEWGGNINKIKKKKIVSRATSRPSALLHTSIQSDHKIVLVKAATLSRDGGGRRNQ